MMKASSTKVLQIVGLLCLNRRFREDFFSDPVAVSTKAFGNLSAEETVDVERLGGGRELPPKLPKEAFRKGLTVACEKVSDALGCDTCPSPPCPPCPDTSSYY